MSVNYKQGVNGVGEAVFVFAAHRLQRCHSKAGTCCHGNIVEIIPFQKVSLSRTGRMLQSKMGCVEGLSRQSRAEAE